MSLKNKLLIVIVLLCLQQQAQSQVWSDNLMKYWYYRDRLEYFVMPGTLPGQSMVADIRNQPWELYYGIDTRDNISFGQQYTRMGFYLGMLATEYRLLKDNGQMHDLPSIVYEIELALNALIRTDMHESGPPWSYLGITQDYLDGFFVREDVPPLFNAQYNAADYLLHFNKDLPDENISDLLHLGYYGKPAKISYNKVKCINALFNDDNPVNHYYNYEGKWVDIGDSDWISQYKNQTFNSHDEVIGVLIGLALVYNLVDEPLIKQTTSEIADRLTRFMWQHPRCGGNLEWRSLFPDCTYMGETNGGIHSAFAVPLNRSRLLFDLYLLPMSEGIDLYEILWGSAIITAPNIPNNSHKLMTTQLLCLSDYAPLGQARLAIQEISWGENWDTFYLLVYSILHNKNPIIYYDISKLQDQLNMAPCGGTYSYSNYDGCPISGIDYSGVLGWASENKFTHSFFAQIFGQSGFPGTYHGLDYMLLYNLASLSFPLEFPFVNTRDRKIDADFPIYIPFPSYEIGTHANPLTILAINSIQCNSFINSDGNLTLIAGESIDLLPGFETQNGCEFEARIESYNCNGLPHKNMNVPAWDNKNMATQFDSIIGIPYEFRQKPNYKPDDYFSQGIYENTLSPFNPIPENENSDVFQLNCYPNPAIDYVHIEMNFEQSGILKIDIFNHQSSFVDGFNYGYVNAGTISKTINISSLTNGQYVIRISFNNSVQTWSFIKL